MSREALTMTGGAVCDRQWFVIKYCIKADCFSNFYFILFPISLKLLRSTKMSFLTAVVVTLTIIDNRISIEENQYCL